MRYIARNVHGIDGLGWAVESDDGGYRVADAMQEPEAHIFAFALNAVAEGKLLCSMHPTMRTSAYSTYDGPTDGVAPKIP